MTDIENNKLPWRKPEIFSLEFKKTEGGLDPDHSEDDFDFYDMDPSGEV